MKNKDLDFETKAIHVGQDPDPVTGAVIPPIYTTSTYAQESPGEHKGYDTLELLIQPVMPLRFA